MFGWVVDCQCCDNQVCKCICFEKHILFYHCLVASNAPLNLYRTLFPVGDVCSPAVLSSNMLVLITALFWDPISTPGPSERIRIAKHRSPKTLI
jgi:hypothetical protein